LPTPKTRSLIFIFLSLIQTVQWGRSPNCTVVYSGHLLHSITTTYTKLTTVYTKRLTLQEHVQNVEQLSSRSTWRACSPGAHAAEHMEHLVTRSTWSTWSSCSSGPPRVEHLEHLITRSNSSACSLGAHRAEHVVHLITRSTWSTRSPGALLHVLRESRCSKCSE